MCFNSPESYYCKCPNECQMSQDNKTCKCSKGFQESVNRSMCFGKCQHKDSTFSNQRLRSAGEHVRLPKGAIDVENRFHNCVRE